MSTLICKRKTRVIAFFFNMSTQAAAVYPRRETDDVGCPRISSRCEIIVQSCLIPVQKLIKLETERDYVMRADEMPAFWPRWGGCVIPGRMQSHSAGVVSCN